MADMSIQYNRVRRWHGLTQRDIAEETNIGVSTVKTCLATNLPPKHKALAERWEAYFSRLQKAMADAADGGGNTRPSTLGDP